MVPQPLTASSSTIQQAIASSWTIPPWATLLLLLTALIYLRGWSKGHALRPEELPSWRAACFFFGLASLWLAIASPLDAIGGFLLSAHMVQHLVLMAVAPPLLLLGAPSVPLLRGLPPAIIQTILGPLMSTRLLRRVAHILLHPVFGWLAMNLAYIGWHVPAAYELTLRSGAWHEFEHACFFTTSLLFWWTVIQPWPSRSVWSRWAAVPYLITADLVNTGLSAFLTFSGRVLYPTYADAPRIFDISALNDQIAAGAFMWVACSTLYLVPAVALVFYLVSSPRRRQRAKPAAKFVILQQKSLVAARFDILKLPVIGHLLRARYGRQTLQGASLLLIALVVAHGLQPHQMAAMNLAGVFAWNIVRGLALLAILFAGNLFCMACPFMLPRELGHRLGLSRLRWPSWLRLKWIGIALIAAVFFSYERFSLWDNPSRTAWLLIAYFATAFVVDTFFQGASFCKYVCPIGQFNFVASLVSPLTLAVSSQSTCTACTTRDCIRGNTLQRGCELDLYLPQKAGNLDCTLCMDCVKACPHDNIGLYPRSPAADILDSHPRSSLGSLARRIDIAVLTLVLVFAAFVSATVMVAPGKRLLQTLAATLPFTATTFGSALAVAAPFLLALALFVLLTRRMHRSARSTEPSRTFFTRYAFALLPLGLGLWAAHLLFHLVTSLPTIPLVFLQALHDLGLSAVAMPAWNSMATFSGTSLLQFQLALLDAGMLLALYLGWQLSCQLAPGRRWSAFAPFSLTTIALYALAFWLLLQPMEMRDMMNMGWLLRAPLAGILA